MNEDTEVVIDSTVTPDVTDRFEVETNIEPEPKQEVAEESPKEVIDKPETEPKQEPQEPKSTISRNAQKKAARELLIRENAIKDERIRHLEAEFAKLNPQEPKPEVKQERDYSKEPNITDYEDVLEYNRDIAKYEARQAFQEETSKLSKQKQIEAFEEKADVLRAEKPDFDEKLLAVRQSGLVEPQVEDAIMSSGMSAEVLYHLAQYPSDLVQLRGLPKELLPKAMKTIEAFIKQGATVEEKPRVTKAQPPITPPGNTAKTDRSINSYTQEEIENMPLDEYNKRFNVKR